MLRPGTKLRTKCLLCAMLVFVLYPLFFVLITMPMSEHVRAHIFVRGHVQGVFFRARTREQAQAAGVAGWVRNLDDGRVEAVFEGPHEAVQRVVQWCHSGPRHAHVDDVEVAWEQPSGQEQGFRVVH